VWADDYQELGDYYDFGIHVDVEGNLGATLVVTSRTPSDPSRVIISLARFPKVAVAKIRGG
jgi:hypothetical protein